MKIAGGFLYSEWLKNSAKFLMCKLSLILGRIFFWVWAKKIFGKLLRPFVVSIAISWNFRCFRYFKNYWKYWIHYVHAPTFMGTLIIWVSNWCAWWACVSGTDAHPDNTHQLLTRMLSMLISFPIFQMFIFCTLSMHIRNWCMHWACTSGSDAYAEHMSQELVRAPSTQVRYLCLHRAQFLQNMLSIRIRDWCVHWADVFTEHTHQELMHTLSICVSFWRVY